MFTACMLSTSPRARNGRKALWQSPLPFPAQATAERRFPSSLETTNNAPGLLLLNGVVYTAWSSHCDAGVYHGWLIGYDARTLRQVSVYNSTPNGGLGSFWASGAAPTTDGNGNIFLISGNGSFDADRGGPDLGESFLKLSTVGGLSVAD